MALPLHGDGTSQHDEVIRLLADAPDGLSDGELTRALAPSFSGIRPQTVNQLCRRMVAAGTLERVGSRPIRNRLVATPSPVDSAAPGAVENLSQIRDEVSTPAATEPEPDAPDPDAVENLSQIRDEVSTPAATEPEPDAPGPEAVETPAHIRDADATPAAPDPEPPRFDALRAVADGRARPARRPGADHADDLDFPRRTSSPNGHRPAPSEPEVSLPVWDALQGWSRTANVTAAVADWLRRRGATIRAASASAASPAHDLVVRLDGDDLHVEVTGWPAEGARTHPTTLAADWFSAATRAAQLRRRAHPRARVVIALPDTRRYRALAEDRAAALAGVGTEVWFVGPGGTVHPN